MTASLELDLNEQSRKPIVGLALGSGASRGWSHIGVIKALASMGVSPGVVCGTSVGAIVGGAYASGILEKLEEWVLQSTRSDVLRFFQIRLSKPGFVDSDRLKWFVHNYVASPGARIEDLEIKFAAVATELETGRELWLKKGNLAEAVSASMAMPGLFPAVDINGKWAVDGGLVNPVPVSTCRALGADIVIAINLNAGIVGKLARRQESQTSSESKSTFDSLKQQVKTYSNSIFPERNGRQESPGLFYAIANSINIVQDRVTRSRLSGDPADLLITPKVADIGLLEFHRAQEAITEGERAVKTYTAELETLMQ